MDRATEFYLGLCTLLFITGTAVLLIAQPIAPRDPPSQVLELTVAEVNRLIRLDWNPADVQDAESGTLRVTDGGGSYVYPVDLRTIQSGGLDYRRRSDDVLLTLVVRYQSGAERTAVVRSFGSLPPAEQPQEAQMRTRAQ